MLKYRKECSLKTHLKRKHIEYYKAHIDGDYNDGKDNDADYEKTISSFDKFASPIKDKRPRLEENKDFYSAEIDKTSSDILLSPFAKSIVSECYFASPVCKEQLVATSQSTETEQGRLEVNLDERSKEF